jgi:hypothetical protein
MNGIQTFDTFIQRFAALGCRRLAVHRVYIAPLRGLVAKVVAITKKGVVVRANGASASRTVGVISARISGAASALTETRRAGSARAISCDGTNVAVVGAPQANSRPSAHGVGVLILALVKQIAFSGPTEVGGEIAIAVRRTASSRSQRGRRSTKQPYRNKK